MKDLESVLDMCATAYLCGLGLDESTIEAAVRGNVIMAQQRQYEAVIQSAVTGNVMVAQQRQLAGDREETERLRLRLQALGEQHRSELVSLVGEARERL